MPTSKRKFAIRSTATSRRRECSVAGSNRKDANRNFVGITMKQPSPAAAAVPDAPPDAAPVAAADAAPVAVFREREREKEGERENVGNGNGNGRGRG
jgi:hypothetical protein